MKLGVCHPRTNRQKMPPQLNCFIDYFEKTKQVYIATDSLEGMACILSLFVIAQVSHVNESWHTYEWVMAHTWLGRLRLWRIFMHHYTVYDRAGHTYEWVMAHIRKSHGTHTNETWHARDWDVRHIYTAYVFWVSINLNLQSQSDWSFFSGTWQKRPRELDIIDWDLRLKK